MIAPSCRWHMSGLQNLVNMIAPSYAYTSQAVELNMAMSGAPKQPPLSCIIR